MRTAVIGERVHTMGIQEEIDKHGAFISETRRVLGLASMYKKELRNALERGARRASPSAQLRREEYLKEVRRYSAVLRRTGRRLKHHMYCLQQARSLPSITFAKGSVSRHFMDPVLRRDFKRGNRYLMGAATGDWRWNNKPISPGARDSRSLDRTIGGESVLPSGLEDVVTFTGGTK